MTLPRGSAVLAALTLCCALPSTAARTPPGEGAAVAPRQAPLLTLVDAATALVPMPASSPKELSGLTYAGGERFYAVADSDHSLHPYTIRIDGGDGRPMSVIGEAPIPLLDAGGRASALFDLEGVAFDRARQQVVVVDEGGLPDPTRSILRFSVPGGRQAGAVDLSDTVFTMRRVRDGLGLESLALHDTTLWTVNEEALTGDGPRATNRNGTLVRLSRFDDGRLSGQWAYITEPTGGPLPYLGTNMGGVVDLAVLPDGRLLALERATVTAQAPGDLGGFLSRIYEVDLAGATNVAADAELQSRAAGTDYQPVRKRLLWSRLFSLFGGPNNFEGMALGPVLDDGSRSVLLVSDNDVMPSNLWALRLSGFSRPSP